LIIIFVPKSGTQCQVWNISPVWNFLPLHWVAQIKGLDNQSLWQRLNSCLEYFGKFIDESFYALMCEKKFLSLQWFSNRTFHKKYLNVNIQNLKFFSFSMRIYCPKWKTSKGFFKHKIVNFLKHEDLQAWRWGDWTTK